MLNEATALESVMSGREERAAVQARLLSDEPEHFVCQITLNVPGFPKRMAGDEKLLEVCRADFLKKICREPLEEVKLANGAGLAVLMLFDGGCWQASGAKRAGIFIEENKAYGRVIDLDVITVAGPLSRREFNLDPRRCLLCDKDSKECSRERNHSGEELRTASQILINKIMTGKK